MNVKESLIIGKVDQKTCEDNIFMGNRFAAIIDGATSTPNKIGGKKSGKFLSDKLKEIISNIDLTDIPFSQVFETINNYLIGEYKKHNIDYSFSINLPAAAMILYCNKSRKIMLVGDCQALLLDVNGRIIKKITDGRKVDYENASVRSHHLKMIFGLNGYIKYRSREEEPCYEFMQTLINEQRFYENQMNYEYSYLSMNGLAPKYNEYDVPKDINEIVLASDGYLDLKPTLELSENVLHNILKTDPMLVEEHKSVKGFYKGQKSFDDRAYIRFLI